MPAFEEFEDIADAIETLPEKPKHGNEQTAALPDGDYDVRIVSGKIEPLGKTNGSKFVFAGVVLTEGKYKGWACEKDVILTSTKGTDEEKRAFQINKLGEIRADLKTMGFDTENWTRAAGRPFPQQWKIACNVMPGVIVKVRKKQNGQYANVYINKRLANLDGMLPTFGEEEMAASASASSPPAGDTMADGDPLPF